MKPFINWLTSLFAKKEKPSDPEIIALIEHIMNLTRELKEDILHMADYLLLELEAANNSDHDAAARIQFIKDKLKETQGHLAIVETRIGYVKNLIDLSITTGVINGNVIDDLNSKYRRLKIEVATDAIKYRNFIKRGSYSELMHYL